MANGLQQELLLIGSTLDDAANLKTLLHQGTGDYYKITHILKVEDMDKIDKIYVYDAVILDIALSELVTMQSVEYLKKYYSELPLIILLSVDEAQRLSQSSLSSVQDYLIKKDASGDMLRKAMYYAVQKKRYEQKIAHLTHYDQLTGLQNSGLFYSELRQTIRNCRKDNTTLTLYMIDIMNFTEVNDLHGRDVGSSVLIEIASRLKSMCRDEDYVARIGDDEFVLARIADDDALEAEIVRTLHKRINEPCYVGDHEIYVNASIGVAAYPDSAKDAHALVHHAHIALQRAKKQRSEPYEYFDYAHHASLMKQIGMSNALKKAVQQQEFQLCYQPKICMRSNRVLGAEALLRWNHAEFGTLLPNIFIPVAEELGLMKDITQWVFETACADFQDTALQWLDIAINVSAKQFNSMAIIDMVKDTLARTKIDASRVQIELTETAVMSHVEQAMQILQALKKLEVAIHIDDFGTGYSCLDYLRRFPVDALKIDHSFIADMHGKHQDTFIRMIIELAHTLGLEVVAEGVETKEQVTQLAALNCDVAQGFIYAKALDKNALITWLSQRPRLAPLKNSTRI
jgi:diguanylate cyclase (GGDEF)-like protein